MSWLEKLLPAKIEQTDPADRRTVPEPAATTIASVRARAWMPF